MSSINPSKYRFEMSILHFKIAFFSIGEFYQHFKAFVIISKSVPFARLSHLLFTECGCCITLQSIKILAQLTSQNVLIKTFNYCPIYLTLRFSMFSLKGSNKTSKSIQTSTALFQDPPAWKASAVGRFATAKTKARTTKSAKLFFMSSCMRCLTENLTVWIWRHPHNLSITESVGRILFWKPLFMQNENKRSVKKLARMKSLLQMNLQAIKI